MTGLGPTHHAVERYRTFYPKAERSDLVAAATSGVEVEAPIACRLVGRGRPARSGSVYRMHPERTGLLVIDPATRTIVTFLRFYSDAQRRLAIKLYGEGEPTTADYRWLEPPKPPEPEPEPPAYDVNFMMHPSNPLGPLAKFGAPWSYVTLSPGAKARLGGSRKVAKALLFTEPCRARKPGSPRFTDDERLRAFTDAGKLDGWELVALCRGDKGEPLWIGRPDDGPGTLKIRSVHG